MSHIFDFLFGQYFEYETTDVVLEIIAVIFGFLSVLFSKQNKIWVFPTGMISTLIFVYLLLKWGLLGDMMINATAIFFVGMWLMAKRKIENWIYWIIGDIISVPLYFYKGFTFTSFQYLGFTVIAIFGYLQWKKHLNSNLQTV